MDSGEVNEKILNEIDVIPEDGSNLQKFLEWLVKFERKNLDKEKFSYKEEFISKLNEFSE